MRKTLLQQIPFVQSVHYFFYYTKVLNYKTFTLSHVIITTKLLLHLIITTKLFVKQVQHYSRHIDVEFDYNYYY